MACRAVPRQDHGVLWCVPLWAVGLHLRRATALRLPGVGLAADSIAGRVRPPVRLHRHPRDRRGQRLGVADAQHGAVHAEEREAAGSRDTRHRLLRLRVQIVPHAGCVPHKGGLLREGAAAAVGDIPQPRASIQEGRGRGLSGRSISAKLRAVHWHIARVDFQHHRGQQDRAALQLRLRSRDQRQYSLRGPTSAGRVGHRNRARLGGLEREILGA
mmetsp:Transcript_82081/g.250845  ORF Transcript_82081/g.250845 Transcript_82081/m.250845 type:complete len:215 (-) Transcript_82081:311-955(-)